MRRLTVAAVACLVLVGCTGGGQQGPTTIPPSPTQFDGLNGWLTTERQEKLADVVATLAKDHGWAAGCVFRYHTDESVLREFPWPGGRAAYSVVNDPDLYPAMVLYVEGGTKASGSFREVLPGAAFCYVPD